MIRGLRSGICWIEGGCLGGLRGGRAIVHNLRSGFTDQLRSD